MQAALDSRAEFEAWARDYGTWEVVRDDDPKLGITGYTDVAVTIAWHSAQACRAALSAEPVADCQRCKGSGEDPEGFYDQSRGPDGDTHDEPCRACIGTGEAGLEAVPQGWKLVPIESTEEMARAFRADDAPHYFAMTTIRCNDFSERYRAALSAAPQPAAQENKQ